MADVAFIVAAYDSFCLSVASLYMPLVSLRLRTIRVLLRPYKPVQYIRGPPPVQAPGVIVAGGTSALQGQCKGHLCAGGSVSEYQRSLNSMQHPLWPACPLQAACHRPLLAQGVALCHQACPRLAQHSVSPPVARGTDLRYRVAFVQEEPPRARPRARYTCPVQGCHQHVLFLSLLLSCHAAAAAGNVGAGGGACDFSGSPMWQLCCAAWSACVLRAARTSRPSTLDWRVLMRPQSRVGCLG